MQRLCVFLALLLTTTTSQAQTSAPAPATPAPAQAPAPAANPAPAAGQPATTAAASKPATQNARLAPGGVVAGGSSFPLRMQLTLDNSLGNGVLAPGYQAQPVWGTALNVRPSLRLPNVEGLPRAIIATSFDFFVNNWLSASTNNNAFERQLQVGDVTLAAILPGIYTEPLTGIGLSLIASGRAPLSTASRHANLITNLGVSAQVAWNSPDTPIGSFFAQYNPGVRGNIFGQVGSSVPCDTPSSPLRSNNPSDGIGELAFSFGRDAEVLPNGECVLAGRQNLFFINNGLTGGWSLGDHNVSLGVNWSVAFMRGLSDKGGLSSPFASGQNFRETSSGSLSYTYTVPIDTQMFLTAGISNQNPSAYNNQGGLRFPLYDFVTPANNFSSAFFDITVGI